MGNPNLMPVWERGVRLKAVYLAQFYYLTDSEILQACKEIRGSKIIPSEAIARLFESLREAEEQVLPRAAYWKECTDFEPHGDEHPTWQSHLAVLHLLQNGMLAGLGFPASRSADDPVYAIPEDVWQADIDWERDSVSGNGFAFTGVRVVPAISDDALAVLPEPPRRAPETTARKPGRPSKRAQIIAAYEELEKLGRVYPGMTGRERDYAVFRHLREVTPAEAWSEDGLSETTIRKTLNSFLSHRK